MATVDTISSLQSTITVAQRKVQQSQNQVQEDNARLAQSRVQLGRDEEQVRQAQQQSTQARQVQAAEAAKPPAIDLGRAIQLPATQLATNDAGFLSQRQPQLNAQGQTIGRLINITA